MIKGNRLDWSLGHSDRETKEKRVNPDREKNLITIISLGLQKAHSQAGWQPKKVVYVYGKDFTATHPCHLRES